MFKPGDKVPDKVWSQRVVCIYKGISPILKEGEVYTIDVFIKLKNIGIIIIDHIEYNANRFISIKENRRRKLEKIRSKIHYE
jgi:hypothetical protein